MIVDIVPLTRLPRGISDTYSYCVPNNLVPCVRPGIIMQIEFRNRDIDGIVKSVGASSEIQGLKFVKSIRHDAPIVTGEQIRLARWMANTYFVSLSSSAKLFVPEIPKSKVKHKILKTAKKNKSKKTPSNTLCINSHEKADAFIKSTIKKGLQVLYLVPEKSWLDKTANQYAQTRNRLIWNKTTAKKKRFEEYLDVLSGDYKLIIGTRSSLFAPFSNLGLIIMESEHNSSYKSESSPKYHAREVAQTLAKLHGATLVYLTNSPSVEVHGQTISANSPASIRKTGQFRIKKTNTTPHTPTAKYEKSNKADVLVVDIREERLKGNYLNTGDALQKSINQSLKNKRQVFLFLNRRGHSTGTTCQKCGHTIHCPTCDLPLTFHSDNRLICHHCRYHEDFPPFCPKCSSPEIKLTGKGTQKLESEIKKLYPESKILRIDKDSVGIPNSLTSASCDIIIGTEFAIHKINWKKVSTIGIINADQALYRPDFRAGESTYHIINLLRDKCDLSETDCRLIIQTYSPDNIVLQSIVKNDPDLFYQYELKLRKTLGYPPYTTTLKMTYKNKDEKRTVGEAMHMYHRLRKHLLEKTKIKITKPYPAYRKKINGKYNFHMVVKIPKDKDEEFILEKINELINEPGWTFDRNPESLL